MKGASIIKLQWYILYLLLLFVVVQFYIARSIVWITFYTWASGSDIRGNLIPRIVINKWVVVDCCCCIWKEQCITKQTKNKKVYTCLYNRFAAIIFSLLYKAILCVTFAQLACVLESPEAFRADVLFCLVHSILIRIVINKCFY